MDARNYPINPRVLVSLREFLLPFGAKVGADETSLVEALNKVSLFCDISAVIDILLEAKLFGLDFTWPEDGRVDYYFMLFFVPHYNKKVKNPIINKITIEASYLHPIMGENIENTIWSTGIDAAGSYVVFHGAVLNDSKSTYAPQDCQDFLTIISRMKDKPFEKGVVTLSQAAVSAFNPQDDPVADQVKNQVSEVLGGWIKAVEEMPFSQELIPRVPLLLSMLEQTLNLPTDDLNHACETLTHQVRQSGKRVVLKDLELFSQRQDLVDILSFYGNVVEGEYHSLAFLILFADDNGNTLDALSVAMGQNGSVALAVGSESFVLVANNDNDKTACFEPDKLSAVLTPSEVLPPDRAEQNQQLLLRVFQAFGQVSAGPDNTDCEKARRRVLRYLANL